jgi:DNA repair exonuclease SbcCD ATPase subunit
MAMHGSLLPLQYYLPGNKPGIICNQNMCMKKLSFLMICGCLVITASLKAQSDDPVAYMASVGNIHKEMNQSYMAYMSAAAHGRRARRIEKMRQQTLTSITNSQYKTADLPYYKGDNSLRQSSLDYIKLCYNIFNEDYNKIVNMEEIAEQSIDQMEAYILMQEKTSEKLKEAADKMEKADKDFAAKYNIRLVESKDELGNMMEKAGKLTHYNNQLYIIFFKCNFQDGQMIKAMNEKKVNDIEQSRNALLKYADEGLKSLDELRTFEGDARLSNSCRQLLNFYKKYATTEAPKTVEFFLKQDNFEKLTKNIDAKTNRTKEDVDAYNAAVKDINNASNQFNQVNTNTNNMRSQLLQNWEEAQKLFNDAHMPHYKS